MIFVRLKERKVRRIVKNNRKGLKFKKSKGNQMP